MSANVYVIEYYENETTFRLQKNKPKQTQFQTGHLLVDRMKPKLLIILVVNFVDIAHWLATLQWPHFRELTPTTLIQPDGSLSAGDSEESTKMNLDIESQFETEIIAESGQNGE